MILAILISETTSNTASAAVVVPIVIPVAVAAGVDPFVPALAATFAASFGFMLPVSTPQNAIVYGSGMVPITQMVRNGFAFDVIGAILIVIGVPIMVSARASAASRSRLGSGNPPCAGLQLERTVCHERAPTSAYPASPRREAGCSA